MANNINDPGLGTNYKNSVARLLNADGSYNIKKKGSISGFKDIYKSLIDLSTGKFLCICLLAYLLLNILFALIYWFLGIDGINGIDTERSYFLQAFYFSAQTFTTVGYGALSPNSDAIQITATIEAFVGFISFSIATGLLYGRFSRPNSKIGFSDNLLITKHKNGKGLMFKMANLRKNTLLKTNVDVILAMDKEHVAQGFVKEYHRLDLEVNEVKFFPLTWTVVHDITENSPLYAISLNDLEKRNAEIIILVKAFDETFSQDVFQKHSYAHEQIKDDLKFEKSFYADQHGTIILNLDQLNKVSKL